MIKLANQVPSVYTSASRDFQYISWLIDIVLNSVKHNVDDVYNLPNNSADPKLTELLALTLGFKVKRNYNKEQLAALVAALPRILKYKGTKMAVDMAGNALISASGASGDFLSETCEDANDVPKGEIRVTFPVGLVDITLFIDLLDYILPAGMTCHIVRKNQEKRTYATELDFDADMLLADWVPDVDYFGGQDGNETLPGLSNMFDVSTHKPNFTNFVGNDVDKVYTGLLDNSIIPTLYAPMNSVYTPNSDLPVDDVGFTEELNDFGITVIIDNCSISEVGDDKTVIIGGEDIDEE